MIWSGSWPRSNGGSHAECRGGTNYGQVASVAVPDVTIDGDFPATQLFHTSNIFHPVPDTCTDIW